MDFIQIKVQPPKTTKKGEPYIVSPEFIYGNINDLVVQGGTMRAFWHEGSWSNNVTHFIKVLDDMVTANMNELRKENPNETYIGRYIHTDSSGVMTTWQKYLKQSPESDIVFNKTIHFSDEELKREDYATFKLSYTPTEGECPAFDKIINHLYAPEERDKILWFMGALLGNNMSQIQKFMYLYGGAGSGKGTIIKIFKMLCDNFWGTIDLELLTGTSAFATSQVKEVPLLIDDDSDISKIKKDVNLLKLTAHEPITVNAKYMTPYDTEFSGLLITASNQRYSARDAAAGINRRAVVVEPSGMKFNGDEYFTLMEQVKFELPAIANKAISFFNLVGRSYYDEYYNTDMLDARIGVFDFVKEYEAALSDPISLKSVSDLYKLYLEDNGYETRGYKKIIANGLCPTFYTEYHDSKRVDGVVLKRVFAGYKPEVVHPDMRRKKIGSDGRWLKVNSTNSLLDKTCATYPAQYATSSGVPTSKWENVTTTLSDIDTTKLHYVRLPLNHIVIDFDLKNSEGEKDIELNLEAANKFPPTYAELSKSGNGVHLHYMYDGDVSKLNALYEEDIEVKVFSGNSSLRRMLTECNEEPIAHIATGLPLKEEDQMYEEVSGIVWTEKKMRTSVIKNLRKEYHSATKPSVDFIVHIFEEAARDGVKYDLTDLKGDITTFAMQSSHNARYCLDAIQKIKYSTIEEELISDIQQVSGTRIVDDEDIHFYDVEVFPNLFVLVEKKLGGEKVKYINPTPAQVEKVVQFPLVGFNNRGYDNHIITGALMGESNMELFQRSQAIIEGSGSDGKISSAYELSYADIYEYSSKKLSLKKWEIELGIHHDEMELPWDQPVPEELWERVAEYCGNDVDATEEVFKATHHDYVARKILAVLSGLSINTTTQEHAARFLFGNQKRPQDKFIYTDLSKEFPGYTHGFKEREIKHRDGSFSIKQEYRSNYRDEDPGEGGYVYSEPGVYENVGLFDIASMHPHSLIALNYFGEYTQRFADLVKTRIYIKHKEFDKAREMFDGVLRPFLEDETDADNLAYALKIIINIVYGMTSAKYDNKFRQKDNHDNIVAKRGALFMINLKHEVQKMGYTVAHIKTDSIKIPNADEKIWKFIYDYGLKYGYTFEHEHTYKKMALINKAVYIAQLEDGSWEPTGAQFAEPYVYKTLFSKEPIEEFDYAMTKSATAPIYLDDRFVGKVAQVYASKTGSAMFRDDGEKRTAVTGTTGYKWRLMSEYKGKDDIDMRFYDGMVLDALKAIDKYDSVFNFVDIPEKYMDLLLPF